MAGHTPAARMMISITTSDGKTSYVVTDTTWKGSRSGPIIANDIYVRSLPPPSPISIGPSGEGAPPIRMHICLLTWILE